MNPLGIGIDLLYIPRFKKILENYQKRFLAKIFNVEEIEYAYSKLKPWEALAGAFSVKEAFFKAIGGYSPFSFKEITLVRSPLNGKPFLKLQGRAKETFLKKGGIKIDLSLSHDYEYTIAIVYLWGRDG